MHISGKNVTKREMTPDYLYKIKCTLPGAAEAQWPCWPDGHVFEADFENLLNLRVDTA